MGSRSSAVSMEFGSSSNYSSVGTSRMSSKRSSVRTSNSRRSSRRSSRGGSKRNKGKANPAMDEVSEASNEESELGVMRES